MNHMKSSILKSWRVQILGIYLGIMAKYKFRIGVGKLLGLVSNSSFQKTLMSYLFPGT